MNFARLLAKSYPQGTQPTLSHYLPGHLADVYAAADQVLACTADDQLRALDLPAEPFRDRLRRTVLLAAATHDLGKANDHFQGMLDGTRRRKPQGLRHEWATLLFLEVPAVREWLMPAVGGDPIDWQQALWAVAGHHPAYGRPSPPRLFVDGGGDRITLLTHHDDFRECLRWLGRAFALHDEPPTLGPLTFNLVGPDNAFAQIFRSYQQARASWEKLARDEKEKRLVAGIKNCLVAADVAGSALPRVAGDEARRQAWIRDAFANKPSRQRLESIVTRKLAGKSLFTFQEEVGKSSAPVTFVKAGCGTGKTVAAYHWAASQHPTRRLYFCYPTTGTATEGYRDYLHPAEEEIDVGLFHGRADVDLEVVLGVKEDADRPDADAVARIESLDAWSTPVVSCTVDTVLGLVQNNRRGLYAWPALAGAAFVFDEIHAYDDRLFGALLRFLRALPGVPVLLMTASLPVPRLKALERSLQLRDTALAVVPGPSDLETRVRYQRLEPIDARDPLSEVRAALDHGGKVLWVCNTVDRALAAAERAAAADLDPILYHSRFRYEDRVNQHRKVIEAFAGPGRALAICTQVAEMSLDLSATLLVTDLAPVPALIQRLGRLNRRAETDDTWPFIIVEPYREDGTQAVLPYTPADFAAARAWLGKLGSGALRQTDLAAKWEAHDAEGRPAFLASAWLDGGPATEVLELREASPGITVVREQDVPALERYAERIKRAQREAAKRRERLADSVYRVQQGEKMLVQVALPMPPPPKGLDWRAPGPPFKGVPVARDDSIDYHPERGARWQRQTKR
jgi:CRISPR-associated endonuclease/helicase Cas3